MAKKSPPPLDPHVPKVEQEMRRVEPPPGSLPMAAPKPPQQPSAASTLSATTLMPSWQALFDSRPPLATGPEPGVPQMKPETTTDFELLFKAMPTLQRAQPADVLAHIICAMFCRRFLKNVAV